MSLSDTACTEPGCADFAASRRGFLGGLSLGGLTTMLGSAAVTVSAGAANAATDSVLVVLSLRGAADGLSLVVPHGDPMYHTSRPRIGIPRTQLIAQDAFFGMHPSFAPLLPMWSAGELAAVHATGLPVANRSHFAAMEEIEDAQVGSTMRSGWLNRLLGQTADTDPAASLSIGTGAFPISQAGDKPTIGFASLNSMKISGEVASDPRNVRRRSLEGMWDSDTTAMGRAARSAMGVADTFATAASAPDNSAAYPRSDLGRALALVSRTLRGGVGARIVTVDSGQWDMHSNIGTPAGGRLRLAATDLAASLAAFFSDLGPVRDRVTVVTISEFGRQVRENSAGGADHGWGNVMFLAGAGVAGGRYYGRWPGLDATGDNDLAVTTDFRSVLSEVVDARFPGVSLASVFPTHQRENVGAMRRQWS